MHFRHLRYFVAVARSGSFSRASTELHIAQPAVSAQVAALESELGLKLFSRHSRGIEITPAGKALLVRAEQILRLLDDVHAEMRAFRPEMAGEVRLGLPTTITAVLAQRLTDMVRVRFPKLTLHIVEAMTGHLEKWIEQDDIDVAVLFASPPAFRPPLAPLGFERLVLVGPVEGPLSGRCEVTMDDVCALPIIHSTRAHQLRQMLDAYSMMRRRPLNLVAEIDSLAQIKSLVFQTRGYTVLPRTSVSADWVSGPVRFWPILDEQMVIRLFMVPSPRFQKDAQCAAVVAMLEDEIRNIIASGCWTGASVDLDAAPADPVLIERALHAPA
jgi:LysR family nitrogen assimilation transcriptional regulator